MAEATRVVIAIEGGLVSSVTADAPLDYVLIDYDTDGGDPDRMLPIPQLDGTLGNAFTYKANADCDPERVEELFKVVAP